MNDLQFQKELQTNPFKLDEAMLAYLAQNPELKASVQKARAFDQQIEEAFDIEIPEGLEERILMKQSFFVGEEAKSNDESKVDQAVKADLSAALDSASNDQPQMDISSAPASVTKLQPKTLPWWGFGGVAASILVVVFSLNLWQAPNSSPLVKSTDYVAHIMTHVEHDPEHLTAFKEPKSEQDLHKLFLAVGATVQQPLSEMSYAGECVVNGQKGLHLVMQSPTGPVTVIVMPGQQLAAMEAFKTSGYQGELLPVKGGVVAIVAHTMEQVASGHMRFFKAIKFV